MGAWETFGRDYADFGSFPDALGLNYRLHLSMRHRYVFCSNPKAGCSSLKLTLQRLELEDRDFRRDPEWQVHDDGLSPLVRPIQTGNLRRYLEDPGFLKFCFVRNPFERVVSAYLDKIVHSQPMKKGVLDALGYGAEDIERPISFAEFLEALSRLSPQEYDEHWMVQWHATFQESIAYDFVGRFERFNDDMLEVGRRISPDFSQYVAEVRPHAKNARDHLSEVLTPATADKVRELYRLDFDGFGYSYDLPPGAGR